VSDSAAIAKCTGNILGAYTNRGSRRFRGAILEVPRPGRARRFPALEAVVANCPIAWIRAIIPSRHVSLVHQNAVVLALAVRSGAREPTDNFVTNRRSAIAKKKNKKKTKQNPELLDHLRDSTHGRGWSIRRSCGIVLVSELINCPTKLDSSRTESPLFQN